VKRDERRKREKEASGSFKTVRKYESPLTAGDGSFD
jgi:hypothetical protein